MPAKGKVKTAAQLTPAELRQLTRRLLAEYLGAKPAGTLAKSLPAEALDDALKSLRAGEPR